MRKRRGNATRSSAKLLDRFEFGQLFRWHPTPGFWRTTKGNLAFVFPGSEETGEPWMYFIPDFEEFHSLRGENAEERAFAIADAYSRGMRHAA
ncbi:MAG TPA: hypothetical protein VD928_00625 [Candidatus Paceibacterota bacterium]|nr:hypothetical protein [Candidatus Paceibacterota bacterium]